MVQKIFQRKYNTVQKKNYSIPHFHKTFFLAQNANAFEKKYISKPNFYIKPRYISIYSYFNYAFNVKYTFKKLAFNKNFDSIQLFQRFYFSFQNFYLILYYIFSTFYLIFQLFIYSNFFSIRRIRTFFTHSFYMNSKAKTHQEFLNDLNYYDSSQFIVKSKNSSLAKAISTPNFSNENQSNCINEISDIFSMHHMKEFNQIKQFIENQDQCLPLLIKSSKNKGKKTLLSQIINYYHKYQNKTKIFIPNFASVNDIYSEVLYNIMIKLRIMFDINQKVQVNQQKIRRYFKYWLDVTSDKIQKDNLGYAKSEKQTLVIIIDGIDELKNSKQEKVFPQFWLPQQIPKNVKLILSGTSGQLSIEKLQAEHKVKVMNLNDKILSQKLRRKLNPQVQRILQQKNISLFQTKALSWFLSYKNNLKISSNYSFNKTIQGYIVECSSSNLKQNQIKSLLLCLSLSKKGLTQQQLSKIMKLRSSAIHQFLCMFQPFINNYKEYFIITNTQIRNWIEQVYDPMKQKKKIYHQIMAKVISRQQVSIRKLQQEIYHLSQAGNWFQIKQSITQIQNFLILYTPTCKYLLCNSWKKLQYHLNSDPIFEYNKAVQSFLTHYHPKQQQLFKIIYQLSMFLRQYSEFQGAKIPNFRHPLIKGDDEQLQKINVFDEFKFYDMITSLKQVQKKKVQSNGKEMQVKKQKDFSKQRRKQKGRQKTERKIKIKQTQNNLTSEMELERSSQCTTQRLTEDKKHQDRNEQKQEVECLNLQIKLNQQKFRSHYLQILQSYLRQYYTPIKKLYLNDTFVKSSNHTTQMEQDEDYEENIQELTQKILRDPLDLQKLKSSMILKNLDQYFEQNYHRNQNTKFYYYKEWIWIQFPWISQSLKESFSQMIQKSVGNATEYMSMEKELQFIKEVLKISKVSKQNKTDIYQNKKIQLHSIDVNKLKKCIKKASNKSVIRNSYKQQNLQSRLITDKRSFNSSQNNSSINSPNIAKFQLDLSNIDYKLKNQVIKQMSNRCAYDSRVTSNSRTKLSSILSSSKNRKPQESKTFLTQSVNKENKLPYIVGNIKQSRLINPSRDNKLSPYKTIQNKVTVDVYDTKTRKHQQQLNTLINQNRKLKLQIQQVEKTSIMLDSIDQTTPLQQNAKKMQQLKVRRQKILKKHLNQQKLKQKLETIIKICDNNQSHQKQSQLLSVFLQNLKIMTNMQQMNKEKFVGEIEENMQKQRLNIRELIEYKQQLINQLKQYGGRKLLKSKDQIDEEIQSEISMNQNRNIKNCLQKKGQTSIQRDKGQKVTISSKHDSSHSKNNIKRYKQANGKLNTLKLLSQNNKTLSNQVLKSSRLIYNAYQEIFSIFSFDMENYQQSLETSKYLMSQFEQKTIKYKQLNLQYEQLYYENSTLDEQIQKLQEQLKALTEKNESQGLRNGKTQQMINQSKQIKEKKKKLERMKLRTKILQECIQKQKSLAA